MTEWLTQYLAESIITLGLILLTIEVIILGFSTFILFFTGIALILTGAMLWGDILPHTYTSVLVSTALLTGILAVTLWQPLKKMQHQTDDKNIESDFVGKCFITSEAITPLLVPQYKFSGIMWNLKSEQEIARGTEVKIIKAEVGTLWVTPVS